MMVGRHEQSPARPTGASTLLFYAWRTLNAQNALKVALNEFVGPAVRDAGFNGSGKTWRRVNGHGDWAIVNVQSSAWSTSEELRCVINISLVPQPWIAWTSHLLDQEVPKTPGEASGLYRDRIHPTGSPANTDTWWTARNEADAGAVARDMVLRLTTDALPLLANLLERPKLLESLRNKDLGMVRGAGWDLHFMRAEAVLRAEEGMSPTLEELLDDIDRHSGEKLRTNAERLISWVRSRAAAADHGDRRVASDRE